MRSLLVLVPLLVACKTNYNRAALVPRATPRMTTGQPLEGRGQLAVGASSVAHLGDPEPGRDNQGIELPGTQLFGSLKGRIGQNFSFGVLYENGLDQGAKKLNASQPDVDNGNVQGYGLTFDFSIPIDERWRLGIGVDAMVWSCPYVSYETTQTGSITLRETGSDSVETFSASFTPSFKIDSDLTLFGGLTIRQHPTIQQKGMGVLLLDDVEVESGPANYIASAGIEGAVAGGALLLSAVAYYDVSRDPAKYGPGMGVMMSVPFGRRAKAPPQQPPPGMIYTPPAYGPPPPAQPYPPQPYPPQPYPPPAPEAPPAAPAPPPAAPAPAPAPPAPAPAP